MELLDVLNNKGELTGVTKPKKKVHADGDWHRAVHIWFITPKGELLIQHRAPTKDSHPNMWDISAAGHVSAGEDFETSGLREVEEEIGLKIQKTDLRFLGTLIQQKVLNQGTFINNEYNNVYLVEMDLDISKLKIQEDEVDDIRLIPWKEFRQWVIDDKKDLVHHREEYNLLFNYLESRYK